MIKLYGIPNCDTMKKARAWLAEHGIDYAFHDYKKEGIDEATLRGWIGQVGWEALLNRRGMMWRKLPQAVRDWMDEQKAIEVMLETPSIIKRPVLVLEDGSIHVGFKPEQYHGLFQ
ncbi:MAG: ArsC family reductase [Gammaproteobacteria bacterium]|nr:MAG: ArsC family reductase [Gammaproteobacteria bacterium]